MIIGDQFNLAIESGITRAYERLSFRALGFFVIHISGRRYGVYAPDATMLACSLDEVQLRIARSGTHTAPFSTKHNAGEIADAIRDARYAPDSDDRRFFGIPQKEFLMLVNLNHLEWAPDGDEAFDDGSNVLHFDVGDRVRLIAFKWSSDADYHHDPTTLRDLWLEADEFYGVLKQWRDAFEAEWKAAPKMPEDEE